MRLRASELCKERKMREKECKAHDKERKRMEVRIELLTVELAIAKHQLSRASNAPQQAQVPAVQNAAGENAPATPGRAKRGAPDAEVTVIASMKKVKVELTATPPPAPAVPAQVAEDPQPAATRPALQPGDLIESKPTCIYCVTKSRDCNGLAKCASCRHRSCVYIRCKTPLCGRLDCPYMHPGQWQGEHRRQPNQPRWQIVGFTVSRDRMKESLNDLSFEAEAIMDVIQQ